MKPSIFFSLLALLLMGLVVYSGMQREAIPATPTFPPATLDLTPTLAVTATYAPGREPMKLPQNYRENFILYAIVDRPDAVTRKIYITPPAIDAIRNGEDLPERTQIVIEAYDDARAKDGSILRDAQGHFVPASVQSEVHVAELRSEWQIEDLASSSRLGNWNFDAFDSTTGVPNHMLRFDCFSCHNNAYSTNFLFTQAQLFAYAQTGETQYFFCNENSREPCTR